MTKDLMSYLAPVVLYGGAIKIYRFLTQNSGNTRNMVFMTCPVIVLGWLKIGINKIFRVGCCL